MLTRQIKLDSNQVIMRVKVKERRNTTLKNNKPLRRSLRLKLLSVSLSGERSAKTRMNSKRMYRQSLSNMRKCKYSISKHKGSDSQKHTSKYVRPKSVDCTTKVSANPFKSPTTIEDTNEEINPIQKSCKQGKIDIVEESTISTHIQIANKELRLKLFQTIKKDKKLSGNTRFSDVAFLDDNHILALDDKRIRPSRDQRICCFNLDGTLLCDIPVSGYPWSIAVLSPTEAVVSVRRLDSNGLVWISVESQSKSLKITRHIRFEEEPIGLAYMKRTGLLLVSYRNVSYLSLINEKGEEIKQIECTKGHHYRCLVLKDGNILFLDNHRNVVNKIDEKGKESLFIEHSSIESPTSLCADNIGNIYVGNFKTGDILKFDKNGRYLEKIPSGPDLCGMGINRTSSRIIATKDDCLLVYELNKDD